MLDRKSRDDDPLGRHASLIGGIALAALAFGVIGYSNSVHDRREALAEYSRRACHDGFDESCLASVADIRSASAANDVVDLGIWQLITSLAGLVLLGWTLQATRAAVREANDASDAAREAIAVTREGMHRQLRAYVHIVQIGVQGFAPDKQLRPSLTVRNVGATPANKFRVRWGIDFTQDDVDAYEAAFPEDLRIAEASLGPGLDYILLTPTAIAITSVQYEMIRRREASFVVFAHIEYEDIFGMLHETYIKLALSHPTDDDKLLARPTVQGNLTT